MIFRLITCLFILAQSTTYAADFDGLYDDGGWEFIKEKKGFEIYSRPMPGTKVLGFKVEGYINAPIIDIMATLRDVNLSKEWQPDLIEKITVKDLGDLEAITYSRVNMPWPLDDRDYVIHNKLMVHKEKKLLFVLSKSVIKKGWESGQRAVRANIGYSNIGLRPAGESRTYVEWTLFGEPNGNIPNWVVNFYQQSFPIAFFKHLAKRANKNKLPVLPGLKLILVELNDVLKKEDGRKLSSKNKK
jgi:hypothetical protein